MKNIFSANTTSLSILQLMLMASTISGFWIFDYNIYTGVILIIAYFLYAGIGVSMMLHRYWCHRSFEFKSNILMMICSWFALMSARGSILGWVHIHREHHAYSDTEKDPHAPSIQGLKLFFPFLWYDNTKLHRFLVRDLYNATQLKIYQYYILLIILWAVMLLLISPSLLYFGWIVPVTLTQIMFSSFIYFGHQYGYRNFNTNDESRNFWPFGYFLWGEGWHNNHHKNAKNWSFRERWWEIDPIEFVIKLVKK